MINTSSKIPRLVNNLISVKDVFRNKIPPGLHVQRNPYHCSGMEEGIKAPCKKLRQMSSAELFAARKDIKEKLRLGKIPPGKSLFGSSFFFPKNRKL